MSQSVEYTLWIAAGLLAALILILYCNPALAQDDGDPDTWALQVPARAEADLAGCTVEASPPGQSPSTLSLSVPANGDVVVDFLVSSITGSAPFGQVGLTAWCTNTEGMESDRSASVANAVAGFPTRPVAAPSVFPR